ncbi:MAG TPA: ABC transporter permease [Firmicutes bacterium]|nr:ABC transporter permease [Bacillota bacterium]
MDFLLPFFNSLPNAAGQGLIWGIMAIGVYITYRILDVADLTVDGSLATGGAVCALCITMGWNPWLALLTAVLAGMLAGLITGLLHTACGIPAILAGILTQLALYSINLRVMAIGDPNAVTKVTLAVSVNNHDLLVSSRFVRSIGLDNPLILLAIVTLAVILLLYWFFGTESGSALRATGANQAMARAQGISTNFSKVLGLVISNGLVALSGALLAQYQGSSTVDMGRGAIVIGLAAVIIGEVLLGKAFRNFALRLLSAVIGAILYYAVITLVLRLGLETNDLKLLTALVVAIFLTIPYWKGKYFSKRAGKGGAVHA